MLYELYSGIFAISDIPAVYIERLGVLAIADVHLGFEEYMAEKGVYLPRMQLKKVLEYIERSLSIVRANTLIIIGDVKHLFDRLGRRESRDLGEFFTYVTKRFSKTILVRGNHDTFVYSISKRYGVEIHERLEMENIVILHGHRDDLSDLKEKDVELFIMAHEHPSISLKDPTTGYSTKFPCFLLTPLKEGGKVLVLPAAGLYQSGTPVTTSPEGYLSPILRRRALLVDAKPYAIVEKDGVYELPRLLDIEDLLSIF
ncbi:MAG: metallophosphoesterase [Ignisphaera sp.]|nr:metallophosphoesterase [Ignisphaera sp.]MCX8167736.1 metallophosphoesterase [Ignisphaera sp.]MDW8085300.1 metallophosphoesterase [Ignisphaera sp.]